MSVNIPTSTYRLQVSPSFDLHAAAAVCDYVAALGVDTIYLSPLLPSAKGSDHGYDVIAWDTVDPQRGGVDGWTRVLADARSRQLGLLIDIVPNHAGVADPAENKGWWDVLQHGREAEHGHWFDIEWSSGRIRLPVLGDDFESSQLTVDTDNAELRYFDNCFPIAPGTGDGSAAEVHDRQHYELVNWRRADTDQNYRRFFAVTTLAGLRVEDDAVFEATHEQIRRWVDDGIVGLRVDHPDGLADPRDYAERLRALAGPDAWLLVEKILEHGEQLPTDWPVDGTTGYDALAEASGVLVDHHAEAALDAFYLEVTADKLDSAAHIAAGKREIVTTILRAEINRLVRLVRDVPRADEALSELAVAFAVYRSYAPGGLTDLDDAVTLVRDQRPELGDALDALVPRLRDPADELAVRFQQTSGAVMAKGVEDTAFYRYTRFVALNEVGGDPSQFGLGLDAFHEAQQHRLTSAGRGMTTLSTHDTKRGEDVRARLAVLAELPAEWTTLVRGLLRAAPIPDPSFAYLLWQTFVGASRDGSLAERERMHAYAEKAMREASQSTTWTKPDEAFEAAVHAAIDAAYDDPDVHEPLVAFAETITSHGWSNSLSQKLIQLTMPGVPDVYQGTELWDDSLVDPDNRRLVDYDVRRALLEQLDANEIAPAVDASGAAKLWVVSRTLRVRRDHPEFLDGYTPLRAAGLSADHAVAFDRGGAVTVATRLPAVLAAAGGWRDTSIELEEPHTDAFTGKTWQGTVLVDEVLATLPVALLTRQGV